MNYNSSSIQLPTCVKFVIRLDSYIHIYAVNLCWCEAAVAVVAHCCYLLSVLGTCVLVVRLFVAAATVVACLSLFETRVVSFLLDEILKLTPVLIGIMLCRLQSYK